MKKDATALSKRVADLFDSQTLPAETSMLIDIVIEGLESGSIKVVERAEPGSRKQWRNNDWVKKAILLHLRLRPDETEERRPGVHRANGVVIMPNSIIHIGAYLDEGCIINSLSVVGACVRIGKGARICTSAVIANGLSPPERLPVVIEDGAHIGESSNIGNGWIIEKDAVIAPGTILLPGTAAVDAKTGELIRGRIPAMSVVVMGGVFLGTGRVGADAAKASPELGKGGSASQTAADGSFVPTQVGMQMPLIIGKRQANESADEAMEQALAATLA